MGEKDGDDEDFFILIGGVKPIFLELKVVKLSFSFWIWTGVPRPLLTL